MRFKLAVFAFLWSCSAISGSWYWRPYTGGPYGANNGSSYADAWYRSTDINWNQIVPGDTLYICGLHDSGSAGYDYLLTVSASGTSQAPITISGACSQDPGSIIATGQRWSSGWSGPDQNGVYTRTYGGSAGQAIDAQGFLLKLASAPDANSPCRSYSQVGTLVSYKPCGAPVTVYPAGAAPVLRVHNQNYVQIADLTIFNATKLIEILNGEGIVVRNSELAYALTNSIAVTGSTSNGELANNHIHDVGNGPYFITASNQSHDGWVVQGNHIHDVYGHIDSHCIGWQAGSSNIINDNNLHDCEGSGITFYAPNSGQPTINNLIFRNHIHEVKDTGRGGSNQRGIEVNGPNCRNSNNELGNVISENRIENTDGAGIFLKAAAPSVPPSYSWWIDSNYIFNADVGMAWIDGHEWPCGTVTEAGFVFEANSIISPRTAFVSPERLNINLQSPTRNSMLLRGNHYIGSSVWVWQGGTQANCLGTWDSSVNSCQVQSLENFQQISSRDAGSTHW